MTESMYCLISAFATTTHDLTHDDNFFSGWTPSAFVSSRVKKADYSHQKPEDFMDQEVCEEILWLCSLSWPDLQGGIY